MGTLQEIGADTTPQILVLNKMDRIPFDQAQGEPDAAALARRILEDPHHRPAGAVAVSARTGAGCDALLRKIDETLGLDRATLSTFRIPAGEGGPAHTLHEYARVLSTRYTAKYCTIEAEAPESIRRRLAQYLVKPARGLS